MAQRRIDPNNLTRAAVDVEEVMMVDSGGTPVSPPTAAGQTAANASLAAIANGAGVIATASFTPAAAAYGAGDVMGASVEFDFVYAASGLAVPDTALIRILTAITRIDQTAVISGETSYTLHGYSVTQPSAQADNDAWTLASGDLASYRGSISLGAPADLGAACYVKSSGLDQDVRLTTGSMWGRLVTVGAFTATAVARQVTLYGIVL